MSVILYWPVRLTGHIVRRQHPENWHTGGPYIRTGDNFFVIYREKLDGRQQQKFIARPTTKNIARPYIRAPM